MSRSRLFALLELVGVLAAVLVIGQFVPAAVVNDQPATGGDTGSHFWPVKVLHDYGIPHGVLRPWNPGNNGGEGLLVHYFPFPFILMALLGYVIPLGQAFNIGTILPVLTLPVAVWASLRIMGFSMPATILAPMFSSAVVLNEGYSMWGGNGLSTMSGQFAHMYALNFLLLAMACLWREINQQRFPWMSAALFSLAAISHGYVFFGVPLLALLVVFINPTRTYLYRIALVSVSGGCSMLLAAWFVIPMISNNSWTTAHTIVWTFKDKLAEIFPAIFEPIVVCGVASALVLLFPKLRRSHGKLMRGCGLWFSFGLAYVLAFYIFRWLQLVDVRAIPQTQLFWAIALGILTARALEELPQKVGSGLAGVILVFLFFWETNHVSAFPGFMNHNYTGWTVKKNYSALIELTGRLAGDLSQPRVAFEHNSKLNNVGTPRVFEMLPYFANRATTESLYLQSTVLAPMLYSFTSEISERGSCPFHRWPCMRHRLKESAAHMDLLGVGELILSSPLALKNAQESTFLEKRFSEGPWSVFDSKAEVRMVDTFAREPEPVSFVGWRDRFWDWYRAYTPDSPFLVTARLSDSLPSREAFVARKNCHPSTRVDFSGIYLTTDCPGVAHYLKYAFNPSFRSSGGEALFLVSPGYIGIVPKSRELKLSYGASPLWRLSGLVSVLTLPCLLALVLFERRGAFKRYLAPVRADLTESDHYVRPSRWMWSITLSLVLVGYVGAGVLGHSMFFWNWRKIRFDSFEILSSSQGWGVLKRNETAEGSPIRLNGLVYSEGLSTHANSEIQIRLNKPFKYFYGTCGYPDHKSLAKIQCEVRTKNKVLFTSPPLDSSHRAAVFKIETGGEQELKLTIRTLKDNIDYAHAVWVDLRATNEP